MMKLDEFLDSIRYVYKQTFYGLKEVSEGSMEYLRFKRIQNETQLMLRRFGYHINPMTLEVEEGIGIDTPTEAVLEPQVIMNAINNTFNQNTWGTPITATINITNTVTDTNT